MKKQLVQCLAVALILPIFAFSSSAATIAQAEEIPAQMQPYTVIEYVNEATYQNKRGGPSLQKSAIWQTEEQRALLEDAKQNGSYDTAYHEELPKPVKGVVVAYSSDGFLDDITFPDGVENPLPRQKASAPAPGRDEAGIQPLNSIDGLF